MIFYYYYCVCLFCDLVAVTSKPDLSQIEGYQTKKIVNQVKDNKVLCDYNELASEDHLKMCLLYYENLVKVTLKELKEGLPMMPKILEPKENTTI